MVGGRTFRRMITTNEQGPTGQGQEQKLNVITTAIIPDAPKVAPQTEGTDLSKMITTHDEPNPADWMDRQFEADAARGPDSDDVKPISASANKKVGQGKKAK